MARAGTTLASTATASRPAATTAYVAGSAAVTPQSRCLRTPETAAAPTTPRPTPASAIVTPGATASRSARPSEAPSASRRPSSRLRSCTLCAIRP